ncbi:Nitrilase/cyanide hydratase and apolipoprotein N-acyltransferase [Lentisphaera araneosa HTCC2155]|uniref:Nitrilase/cyanide hydratase and apolipoprotein N-acyltransferase n=2 Tax=Lentisphaera TaxID=256846 RepID=A6DN63_9BACT|nr:Nitrilase/cyanide hydratase and apolipoprotein N-acyltransferase [Lentisphaera araneosa HTCC2155]
MLGALGTDDRRSKMSRMMNEVNTDDLRVCLVQMSSSPDFEENLAHAKSIIEQASQNRDELIIFPECALLWAKTDITHQNAKTREQWTDLLSPLSKTYKIAIVWGGLAERQENKVFNSSFIFDADGHLLDVYRKTHLFQIFTPGKKAIDETETYEHGDTGPCVVKINDWSIGISICYDLRFPEFLRNYAGCDLMINSAAFTKATGKAHWEVLMRARAVENQSYVIGSAQCGRNELSGISAYGHSIVIDPWGEVLGDLGESIASQSFVLNKQIIQQTRETVPALYTSFPHLRDQ